MKWRKRGPKWKKAVKACMAVLEGDGTPGDVRKTFEAAAKEEGVLRSSN
jgi:hypothetical protein